MKNLTIKLLFVIGFVLGTAACTDNKRYETAYCALVDTSGTYASEKATW